MRAQLFERIQAMKDEHRAIAHLLEELDSAIRSASSEEEAEVLAEKMKSRLEMHLRDEERYLYAPMRATMGKASPTDSMFKEHQQIRVAVRDFLESFTTNKLTGTSLKESIQLLNSLEEHVRSHVKKEENVLFWLATTKL